MTLPCGHEAGRPIDGLPGLFWGDRAYCTLCKKEFDWNPPSKGEWKERKPKRTLTQSEPSASS